MNARIETFGTTDADEIVEAVTISSGGLSATILTWGAVLHDVRLGGVPHPLTLGSPDLAAYTKGPMSSFGAVMGPVVNRIRDGRALIAGKAHQLETNMGGQHTKHGGTKGPHLQVWRILESSPSHVALELNLPDGLSGFPGNRTLRAEFRVEDAMLDLVLVAHTDAPTILNLANHSYWNLDGSDDATRHLLEIFADSYTENGPDLMVTGRVLPVDGTAFDFRAPQPFAAGPERRFDLNYALSPNKRPLTLAARVTGESGISMEMSTTETGLQLFDFGSFDTGAYPGHHGAAYPSYSGIALEAQAWPGALAQDGWPSIEVRPDAPYHQHTRWAFKA